MRGREKEGGGGGGGGEGEEQGKKQQEEGTKPTETSGICLTLDGEICHHTVNVELCVICILCYLNQATNCDSSTSSASGVIEVTEETEEDREDEEEDEEKEEGPGRRSYHLEHHNNQVDCMRLCVVVNQRSIVREETPLCNTTVQSVFLQFLQ